MIYHCWFPNNIVKENYMKQVTPTKIGQRQELPNVH